MLSLLLLFTEVFKTFSFKPQKYNIIFGSGAKHRVQKFKELFPNLEFSVISPNIDEYNVKVKNSTTERKFSDPAELSQAVALAKANKINNVLIENKDPRTDNSIIITLDQVAYYNGEIREKPKNKLECKNWFTQYKYKPIQVCTSIVILNTRNNKKYIGSVHASQLFSERLSLEIIDELIKEGTVMYCCGGFLVDLPPIIPYLSTRVGTEDEVVGTPLKLLEELTLKAMSE
jgi:predicted house-cleaning NTP pyrophosphatase (Maf/HAM1 superfamily)